MKLARCLRPRASAFCSAVLPVQCLIALLLATGPTRADEVPALFDLARPALVMIHARRLSVLGTDTVQEEYVTDQGSGVVLSHEGKVMTAAHLVQAADEIKIVFWDGRRATARVFASEPAADVALLELLDAPANLSGLSLGDSDAMVTGGKVVTIGFPFGLGPSLTLGRISGRMRPGTPLGPLAGFEVFTTDAHVLKGTSGAPMLNMDGRVIGVATSSMKHERSFIGIGIAVTSNTVRSLLIERRSLWTGMVCRLIDGNLARALNLPQAAGLLVERLAAYSPASALRLRAGTAPARIGEADFVLGGDVVLSMQGVSLSSTDGYQAASRALASLQDGDAFRMTVLRAGKTIDLEIPLQRARR